jgi:hypothetical protein
MADFSLCIYFAPSLGRGQTLPHTLINEYSRRIQALLHFQAPMGPQELVEFCRALDRPGAAQVRRVYFLDFDNAPVALKFTPFYPFPHLEDKGTLIMCFMGVKCGKRPPLEQQWLKQLRSREAAKNAADQDLAFFSGLLHAKVRSFLTYIVLTVSGIIKYMRYCHNGVFGYLRG